MRHRRLIIFLCVLAAIVTILSPVALFVLQPVQMSGMSMRPTLDVGDRLFILRFPRTRARGDLVVYGYPRDQTRSFLHRIVGLPGERLRIDSAGRVYINGFPLPEPYVEPENNASPREIAEVVIPQDLYFVIGDNRDLSNDSRFFGPIPGRLIRGKVVARYWPPTRIGRVSD